MTDAAAFKPKTVYVTYIGSTPKKVWDALTGGAFEWGMTPPAAFGGTLPLRGRDQRKLALNRSSVVEPGHSSFSPSALSGVSTVARWLCRSSGSSST